MTTGQVRFCDATAPYCEDIHLLGTAQLTGAGAAVLRFIPEIGSHSYKAVFAGTQSNTGSSSSAAALTVTAAVASTTTLAQSGAAGNYTLTATVTAQGGASPTGNVSFQDTSSGNAVVGAASLQPQGAVLSWLTPSSPATGSSPYAIATGDFNGDGIPDLAVANSTGNKTVTVPCWALRRWDVYGNCRWPANRQRSTEVESRSRDFNGDGKAGYWPYRTLSSSSVTILLGNGDGTFIQAASLSTGSYPISIAVGDFNGDGIPDLATANEFSSTTTILLGNGDGTFTQGATPATGNDPRSVAVGGFQWREERDGMAGLGRGQRNQQFAHDFAGQRGWNIYFHPGKPANG